MSQIIVAFASGAEFSFSISEEETSDFDHDKANDWLDQEWLDLDCTPTNPVGKVLVFDKVLGVARYAGERRFSRKPEWARRYACAVASLLKRPTIRIDVGAQKIG